jgi:hypothetical protein
VEAGLTIAASSLSHIDWNAPWLRDLQAVAAPILRAADWRAALNQAAQARALCNHRDLALRFVTQEALPPGTAYEEFIDASGCVPTRDNLHDFFNALVWLAYPNVKKRLNALQAAEILKSASVQEAKETAGFVRGKVRDAATIFDENAALFVCADRELSELLRAHCWIDLFVDHRAAFDSICSVRLFGHALMEKLTNPYKAITAHAWIIEVGPTHFALPAAAQREQLDQIVSQQLKHGLTTANFTPLPVLGIPGWWPQQDAMFYADQSVFRPRRVARNLVA